MVFFFVPRGSTNVRRCAAPLPLLTPADRVTVAVAAHRLR